MSNTSGLLTETAGRMRAETLTGPDRRSTRWEFYILYLMFLRTCLNLYYSNTASTASRR